MGGSYEAVNEEWNGCLEPGQQAIFGFEGAHEGVIEKPLSCQFGNLDCDFTFTRVAATSVEEEDALLTPQTFLIESIYPNPFNPQTTVQLRVGTTQAVQVDLWDVQGRRVQSLFNGTLSAQTLHTITIDGSTLHSGLYLVRMLGASGEITTRPITLLK